MRHRPQPMKVLTAYYRPKPGGFTRRLLAMVEAYLEAGWEVHYVSLERWPLEHRSLHHHPLRVPGAGGREGLPFWGLVSLALPLRLARVARRERVDLISVFNAPYALWARPAAALSGAPLVAFIRSDTARIHALLGRPRWLVALQVLLDRVAVAGCRFVFPTSEALRRDWIESRGLRPEASRVLPNDASFSPGAVPRSRDEARGELGLDPGAFVVGTTAVLTARKRLDLLIDAVAGASACPGQGPPLTLVVVGEGPDRAQLERRAREQGLERVVWAGWRDDASSLLRAFDVFAFPTVHEGSPNSLLEALAAGLPCLGADVPEVREILADDALLFALDDPAALGERLATLAADPATLAAVAGASRTAAERYRFDWKARLVADVSEALALPGAGRGLRPG